MAEKHDLLERHAYEYLERGWSVIPLIGKTPAIKWQEYQKRMATDEEIWDWFQADRFHNVGICAGPISKLVVVDVDPRHGGEDSAERLELRRQYANVITGSGGYHYYFYHDGDGISNSAGKLGAGIDVRATGGYVVAPPSVHPKTSKEYYWQHREVQTAPEWLVDSGKRSTPVIGYARSNHHGGVLTAYGVDLLPVHEGSRNSQAASIAGKLLRLGLNDVKTWEVMRLWNSENKPPLPLDEMRRVLNSIINTRKKNGDN